MKKKIQIHKRFFVCITLLLLLNSLGSALVTSNLRVLPGMMFVTPDEWSIVLSTPPILTLSTCASGQGEKRVLVQAVQSEIDMW